MNRSLRTLWPAIAVLVVGTGCVREIDVANEPALVTSIGPLTLDDQQNVAVAFTIRDPEGDDQNIAVDICDAPGDNCGVAAVARGGDPLDRLPTVPKDTDVLHDFRWQPWCGRWIDQQLTAIGVDDEFVVAVWVLPTDSEPVYSEPSTLAALGATEGSCE